jgi:hypothetical protein
MFIIVMYIIIQSINFIMIFNQYNLIQKMFYH